MAGMSDIDFICFDTESAQGRLGTHYIEELLEISILDIFSNTIFYQRFKPARLRRWNLSVHHISPDMVKTQPKVKSLLPEIQKIFNRADCLVGFSLIDDIKALERAGVKGLESKKQVELRHLYWYCVARYQGVPFYSGPGLSKCAEELGVEVIPEGVHTASGDTSVTLRVFHALMERFIASEGVNLQSTGLDIKTMGMEEFKRYVDLALKRIKEAKYDYDRTCAAGYIHLVNKEGGIKFVPSVESVYDKGEVVMTIAVNARRRALYELENLFSSRRSKTLRKIFFLKKNDFEQVAEYRNEFDGQEQLYQKLTGLGRAEYNG